MVLPLKMQIQTVPGQAGQYSGDHRGWGWEGALLSCSFCSSQSASCCQSCPSTSTRPWWLQISISGLLSVESHFVIPICSTIIINAFSIPGTRSWSLPVTEFEQELSCQPNEGNLNRRYKIEISRPAPGSLESTWWAFRQSSKQDLQGFHLLNQTLHLQRCHIELLDHQRRNLFTYHQEWSRVPR